jgi:hypothetical protein
MRSPKQECEDLLGSVMPFAEEMLTKYRSFYPFGAWMTASGEIAHVGGWTGDEHPPSTELITLLEASFRDAAVRGSHRATALAYDVRVVPPNKTAKQDAVAVNLDHRDNYSVTVMFPYTFSDTGELLFEAPFAVAGRNDIFLKS